MSGTQVFYHLGELDSALTYALGAGAHFNVDEQSEYVQTLIGEQQQPCSCGADLVGVGAVALPPPPLRRRRCSCTAHPSTTHMQRIRKISKSPCLFAPVWLHAAPHQHMHSSLPGPVL